MWALGYAMWICLIASLLFCLGWLAAVAVCLAKNHYFWAAVIFIAPLILGYLDYWVATRKKK